MDQEKGINLNTEIKLNFRSIILIVFFIIGLVLIIPRLIDITEALKLILTVNKYYLIIALLFEFTCYIGAATLLGIILSRLGYKIPFWDRFKIGSIAAFAIHFFPVGSFGGGASDYYFLRKRKVESGSILLMFVLRMIISYSAFLAIFLVGLILVPIYPHLPFSPKLVSLVLLSAIILVMIYILYLYEHKEKFRQVWVKTLHRINFIIAKIRKRPFSDEKINEIFDDIYTGIGIFSQKKRTSIFAFLAGLIYWLGDILCFYFVFLSFGYHIHFGVLIFGYCISTLAGLISFIPGGLGVTEGMMGILYSGMGVPLSVALTSILVFRLFSFWIWIPIGIFSFFSLRRGANDKII